MLARVLIDWCDSKPLMSENAALLKESPIVFLFVKGDLLREILPFTKHPPIPLTALCTGVSSKTLFAANKGKQPFIS